MTTPITETSPLLRARIAGFLYLILFPIDLFGFLYVPSRLVVPGDVAATAANIMASEPLFRLGIVSILLGQILGLLTVLVLYEVLKPVNKNMAALMIIFVLVAVPIGMLNELSQFAIPVLLQATDNVTAFTAAQVHALVSLLINVHTLGI